MTSLTVEENVTVEKTRDYVGKMKNLLPVKTKDDKKICDVLLKKDVELKKIAKDEIVSTRRKIFVKLVEEEERSVRNAQQEERRRPETLRKIEKTPLKKKKDLTPRRITKAERSFSACSPKMKKVLMGGGGGKMMEGLRLDLVTTRMKIGNFESKFEEENLARQSGRQTFDPEVASPLLGNKVRIVNLGTNPLLQDKPNLRNRCIGERCMGGFDWTTPGQASTMGSTQPIGKAGTDQGLPGTQLGGRETGTALADSHLAENLNHVNRVEKLH